MTFSGTYPALVTPFDEAGNLYIEAFVEEVRAQVDVGADGILIAGTVGEGESLSREERRVLVSAAVEATEGRLACIVGVSAATGREAAALAEDAAKAGAHSLMCLPPLLYHADEPELIAHFSTVAASSSLPLILYNHADSCHNDLDPAIVARLFEIQGVVALKECAPDVRRISAVLDATGGAIEVLVGPDDLVLDGFASGAVAWMPGTANVAPEVCVRLFRHLQAGRLEEARRLFTALRPLTRLDGDARCTQYLKAAMDLGGRYGGPSRPPRQALRPDDWRTVSSALEALAGADVSEPSSSASLDAARPAQGAVGGYCEGRRLRTL